MNAKTTTTWKWIGEPPPPPAKRPKCGYCNEPLRPIVRHETEGTANDWRIVAKEWNGRYRGYGRVAHGKPPAFCSLRCCARFAGIAYRDGVRITRDKGAGHKLRLRP